MIDELSKQIWSIEAFQTDYSELNRCMIANSLGLPRINIELEKVRKLLQCATHFAGSSHSNFRAAAYRIAVGSRALLTNEAPGTAKIAEFILARLGNFPAVDFLNSLDPAIGGEALPAGIWFEKESHGARNTRRLNGNAELHFTEFQVRLWDALHDNTCVVVTAPTSAGKSFALQHYLSEAFLKESNHICVYVVPTRALVNQVSSAIKAIFSRLSIGQAEVSSIPISPQDLNSERVFYVLTQERLQMLLDKVADLNVSRLVVDEAQVIGDDARGIVLQTVVERVRESNQGASILFGSPTTANPDVFPSVFGLDAAAQIQTHESPVLQNLIFIDTDPHRPNIVKIRARTEGQTIDIGELGTSSPLTQAENILPSIAAIFGRRQQNLVYASSPAKCEEVSAALVDISTTDSSDDEVEQDIANLERKDFAQFLRDHFHAEYFLASAIEARVAFHYGSMPATIRKGIEGLFSKGYLNYLVSTTTLLHGVNLPARNLFLHKPTKGREKRRRADEPISSVEFWNLVGRAGRLKKDFEGNVFLIDERFWQTHPYNGDNRQPVKPSLFVNLLERGETLLEFMSDTDHPSGTQQGIENTFAKLFNEYRNGKLDNTLARLPTGLPDGLKRRLIDELNRIAESVTVPSSISEKNINVSVLRQQEMLDHIKERIREYGPARVVPIHPSRYWEEIHPNILAIFHRIHVKFEKKPQTDRSHTYFAPLAVRWMRGDDYSALINDAYAYETKRRKRGLPSVATVIRNVFDNVESDLRFRYVKFTNCYIDLLKHALSEMDAEEYISRIPALPLYLELGASSDTAISLLGTGISRDSAHIISTHAPRSNMNKADVVSWLRNTRWEGRNLPRLALQEIKEVLSS